MIAAVDARSRAHGVLNDSHNQAQRAPAVHATHQKEPALALLQLFVQFVLLDVRITNTEPFCAGLLCFNGRNGVRCSCQSAQVGNANNRIGKKVKTLHDASSSWKREGWDVARREEVWVALRCVALRCVALRCVALRCVALRCVALRCVALGFG